MKWLLISGALAIAAVGCGKEGGGGEALPPRDQVQLPAPVVGETPESPGGMAPPAGDPSPGAGQAGAGQADPHAGVPGAPALGGGDEADPHGGGGQIDPSQFIRGTIAAADQVASSVKPGDIVFVTVRRIDPATGAPAGTSVALARFDVTALPMPFEISSLTAMLTSGFTGDVAVIARVDRDGEARTRTAGDLEGTVAVTIPAEGVTLTLDTVVE